MFLSGGLDDDNRCEPGMVTLTNEKVLNGLASQGLYEITLREEFARLNELTGSLTLTSGVQARAADKSIVDSLEGTVVWEYDSMDCPQTIVQLYKGMMKAYVNQTNTYEGSTVIVEHQDKDQAASSSLRSPSFCADIRPSGLILRTSLSSFTRMTGWRSPKDAFQARRARETSPDWSQACPSCRYGLRCQ
jgi:hypothetical protein